MFYNSYKTASTIIVKRNANSWRLPKFLNLHNPTFTWKDVYLNHKLNNALYFRLKYIKIARPSYILTRSNYDMPAVLQFSGLVLGNLVVPHPASFWLSYAHCASSLPILTQLQTPTCTVLSVLFKIWDLFLTVIRVFKHCCILLPILILLPLTLNSKLRFVWYKLLVICLELSGPIFIKLGQWASTRRDLFSSELCSYLSVLQTKNTPHSWFYTKQTLERAFGQDWHTFIKLDNTVGPLGCGCCGQVYKAWIKRDVLGERRHSTRNQKYCSLENSYCDEVLEMFGIGHLLSKYLPTYVIDAETCKDMLPVAVKVLHPQMETLLRRDLLIMKVVAKLLTWTIPSCKWLSLPDCVEDFANLMRDQVNLNVEADNLEKFATNFSHIKKVQFPKPIRSMSTSYVLTQTFEEGQHMDHYATTPQTQELKAELADVGLNTILKMVFSDNFIHGDLHPGNILVQELKLSKLRKTLRSWFRRNAPPPIRLIILDCGIKICLEEREKKLLRDVFTSVARGDGKTVADLFLNNSTNQCADPQAFKRSIDELVNLTVNMGITLEKIAVSSLMTQVFTTMIKHKVKIEGCFSSVILAVMVVEGLGRSLDPTIDMVEKARPYLFTPFANWKHKYWPAVVT